MQALSIFRIFRGPGLVGVAAFLAVIATAGIAVGDESAENGFPPLGPLGHRPVPADNPMTPEKVDLGRLLYSDMRLSGDVSLSGATCHNPESGWLAPG